ncbi:unnamed protein product [Hapterophycus canaliculatus]
MARVGECGARSNTRVKNRESRETLYARALSLRKTHLITRALWLVDGIVQRLDPLGDYETRTHGSEVNREVRSSRVAAPSREVQRLKPYPAQHAEYLGIPVMPRNPFRDEMSFRSRAKGVQYCKAASRSGVLASCRGYSSSRTYLDFVEVRAAASKKGRFRNWLRKSYARVLDSGSVRFYAVQHVGPVR